MQYWKKADCKMPVAKEVPKNEGYYTKKTEIYNGMDIEKYWVEYMCDNVDWMEHLVKNIREEEDEGLEKDEIHYQNSKR